MNVVNDNIFCLQFPNPFSACLSFSIILYALCTLLYVCYCLVSGVTKIAGRLLGPIKVRKTEHAKQQRAKKDFRIS